MKVFKKRENFNFPWHLIWCQIWTCSSSSSKGSSVNIENPCCWTSQSLAVLFRQEKDFFLTHRKTQSEESSENILTQLKADAKYLWAGSQLSVPFRCVVIDLMKNSTQKFFRSDFLIWTLLRLPQAKFFVQTYFLSQSQRDDFGREAKKCVCSSQIWEWRKSRIPSDFPPPKRNLKDQSSPLPCFTLIDSNTA